MEKIDMVLLGAEGVVESGGVINKVCLLITILFIVISGISQLVAGVFVIIWRLKPCPLAIHPVLS